MIEQVKGLASEGYSKRQVCEKLKLTRYALYKLLESNHIEWKPVGKTKGCRLRVRRMRSRTVRDRMSRDAAASGRAKLYDVGDGRMLTRGQIAREIGGHLQTVAWRIKNGHTGADLLRPADSRRGARPQKYVYETGLTAADWEQIVNYAREHTPRRAAEIFGLPLGAVKAMLRGEDWRVE